MYIVVWKRKDNTYYFRRYRGYLNTFYRVGYTNQYGHQVILIIEPTINSDNIIKKYLRKYLSMLYKKL